MSYTNGLDKPSDYFNTVLYTGNGGNGHTISGVGFQSDLTWLKSRSSAISHMWIDSVRGVNTVINSNTNDAETTFNCLDPWNSDGFVLSNNTNFNGNGVTFAAWNWLASNGTASNTDGTINSTVSVNTTSGFSIVSYTGTGVANKTIGHGLGTKPSMIIVKNRSIVEEWRVWHQKLAGADYKLILNDAGAADQSNSVFNGQSATTFTVGADGSVNKDGTSIIAYCFAEKQGYSKFGSYTGNGNADGSFIYTGFKPAFVMIKKTTGTDGWWQIEDNKRSPENVAIKAIFANVNDTEYSGANYATDYLSNGFKIRNSTAGSNTSGQVYIYMAFAENPFVTSTGVPATAR